MRKNFYVLVGLAALCLFSAVPLTARASSTSPPRITVTSPKNNATINTPTATIRGTFTAEDSPNPVVLTVNGKTAKYSVTNATSYRFDASVFVKPGSNTITITVDDGNGGVSTITVIVNYVKIPPTIHQSVTDKTGDAPSGFPDVTSAAVTQKGRKLVFVVQTAKPMNTHDGSGNPITACLDIRTTQTRRPAHPFQVCGDGGILGGPGHTSDRAGVRIAGKKVTWTIKIKTITHFIPGGGRTKPTSFKWRARGGAFKHFDYAPSRGFLNFILK